MSSFAIALVALAISVEHGARERKGRHDAGAVAAVNAGFFDVFHDRADDRDLAVGDAIDVHLDRILEKAIDQDRAARADLDRAPHVAAQILRVIDQLHRASAENERRPNEHGITDPLGDRDRFVFARGGAARRLAQPEPVEHLGEKFAVFRQLDAFRRRADDRDAGRLQSGGEIERRLAAELHDHALRFLLFVNVEHVFVRERLEVKFVARVVVGRNGFRIRVHHDGLDPELAQGESGVDAAVVELDPLADAVRSAAEDHDLAFRVRADLVFARRRWNNNTACRLRTPRRRYRRGGKWG